MRIVHKLLLLVGVALGAMAFTAGTASAQETELEVVNESTLVPCVAAPVSNCRIHIVGESHIFSNVVGAIVGTCEDEFRGAVNHNGSGTVTWVGSPHGAPGCNLVNCTGAEANWPIGAVGELGNGTEHVIWRQCFNNGATNLHCNVEMRIDVEDGLEPNYEPHHYVLSTTQNCFGGALRIEGLWEMEHDHDSSEDDEVEGVHHSL